MSKLDEYLGTVKAHVTYYDDRVKRNSPGAPNADPKIFQTSGNWARAFKDLQSYLLEQQRLMTAIPKSLGDISDLPDELVKELSVKKVDELEQQIITVMQACNGEANLDQVLVGLYRSFKVVQTRRYIQNKLYRMSGKELVFLVPGQRAAYSLERQPEPPKETAPSKSDLDDEIPF